MRRGSAMSATTRRISMISRDSASTTVGLTPVPATASILCVRCSISPVSRSGRPDATASDSRRTSVCSPSSEALTATMSLASRAEATRWANSKRERSIAPTSSRVANPAIDACSRSISSWMALTAKTSKLSAAGRPVSSRLASLAMSSFSERRASSFERAVVVQAGGDAASAPPVTAAKDRKASGAAAPVSSSFCRERIAATAFLTSSRASRPRRPIGRTDNAERRSLSCAIFSSKPRRTASIRSLCAGEDASAAFERRSSIRSTVFRAAAVRSWPSETAREVSFRRSSARSIQHATESRAVAVLKALSRARRSPSMANERSDSRSRAPRPDGFPRDASVSRATAASRSSMPLRPAALARWAGGLSIGPEAANSPGAATHSSGVRPERRAISGAVFASAFIPSCFKLAFFCMAALAEE